MNDVFIFLLGPGLDIAFLFFIALGLLGLGRLAYGMWLAVKDSSIDDGRQRSYSRFDREQRALRMKVRSINTAHTDSRKFGSSSRVIVELERKSPSPAKRLRMYARAERVEAIEAIDMNSIEAPYLIFSQIQNVSASGENMTASYMSSLLKRSRSMESGMGAISNMMPRVSQISQGHSGVHDYA
jgi:hypothetical protein